MPKEEVEEPQEDLFQEEEEPEDIFEEEETPEEKIWKVNEEAPSFGEFQKVSDYRIGSIIRKIGDHFELIIGADQFIDIRVSGISDDTS